MSSTTKRLINNFFAILISQAAILLLSTIFVIYLARLLGPSEYGKYVFAVNFPVILFAVCDFFRDVVVRDVAKDRGKANIYLANSLSLNFFSSAIILSIIFIYINLFEYSPDIRIAVYILSIYYFLQRVAVSFDSILNAFENLWFGTISGVFEKAVIVAISLYIISIGGGLTWFVWAFVLGGFVRLVTMILFVKRYAYAKPMIDTDVWKYIFSTGYPLLISVLFVGLMSRIGIVFLSILKDNEAIGLFGVGYSLYNIAAIIATSLTSSLFPLLSRYNKTDPDKFVFLFKTSFAVLFISGLIITFGTFIFSEKIVILFFGKAYIKAVIALKLIFLSLPLFFVRNLLAAILLSADKQKITMKILGLGFLVNLIFNILLIPTMSYVGVSISFIGSEAVIFAFLGWMTYSYTYSYIKR